MRKLKKPIGIAALLSVLLVGALTFTGCEGPQGPQGPEGPQGPDGPGGSGRLITVDVENCK